MNNYNELSDFDINKRVAKELELCIQEPIKRNQKTVRVLDDECWISDFDPCNNPADAWPIIVENNISCSSIYNCQTGICEPTGEWLSGIYEGNVSYKHKNPLRCAMTVFLMMNEKEVDKQ